MGQSVGRSEALVPDTVENLKVHMNPNIPSVTLTWTPPLILETGTPISLINRYHIRFKPNRGQHYQEVFVDGSTNSIIIDRKLGLTTNTTYSFEIRAQNDDDVGQWKAVSAFVDLFPGEVQNLQAKMDTSTPSLILEWDKPSNCETDQDVTSYDIRFRPSGSPDEESYCNMTVRAPATSIVLTRESGLTPLVDYEFEVRAKNPGYDGKWSSKSKYIAFTPDPVEKLTATADTHKPSVTLKWDPPANAGYPGYITKYQVRFWNKEKGCYIESTVDGSTTTTVITRESGLRPLTVTTFEVRACSGDDVSPEWRTVSTFVALDPDPVENLKINMDPCVPSVTLTWAPPQNAGLASPDSCLDVSRYHIRFKPKGRMRYDEMTVDGSKTTLVLKRESGLTPHTTFIFEVRAQSGDCLGQWKTVSVFVDLFPGEVQNLKSTLDPNTASLTLAWERPSNCETAKDVTAYDIWFKPCTSLEKEGYCKTTVKASATSVHLTRESGLKPLMNYQFEIRARNAGYDGNWSRISKYIAFTPDPVRKLTAAVDSHKPSVTLKWDPPANAGYPGYVTKYQVRFWDKEKGCYNESTVDGSTTTTVITRESGLRPLTVTTFEVRACSGRDACPEWRTESAFIALDPDPVENLKIHMDPCVPSVTLTWAPPRNAGLASPDSCLDVSRYHIRFKQKGTRRYKEMTVDGSKTRLVLERESGLIPHTTFIFEVKAQSGDHLGQWKTVASFVDLLPAEVQNLKPKMDPRTGFLTLEWDKPKNCETVQDVIAYDVRFKPCTSLERKDYQMMTVKATERNILLTRGCGLKLLKNYQFEVRARNAGYEGKWSGTLEHIGVTVQNLTAAADPLKPSVTLKWEPPGNEYAADVTGYQIRFWDKERRCYNESTVDGSTTTTVITRESGLRPLNMSTFEVRACSGDDVSQEKEIVSTFVALTPGPVQNLTATVDSHKPAVTLKWDPPANAGYEGDVTDYRVRFWDKERSCYEKKFVDGSITTIVITRDSGLRPLTTSTFEVKACSGIDESQEWRTVSTFVAIVPDSVENLKVQVDSNIPSATLTWDPPRNCIVGTQSTCTDVSSYLIRFKQERQHYNDVYVNGAKTSVVFSEELGLSLHATFTFEVRAQSGDNFGEWKAVSVFIRRTGVMKLDSRSQEYRDLRAKFRKDWAMNKGPCPSIIAIVKIVNSIVSLKFEDCPLKLHGIEQHYHGTTLCCDLANSANLCNDPNCGACGITRRGFDPLRIGSRTWQRFGKGFYFAPNSSKAYDYAIGNRFGANRIATRNTRYSAIILCDIAPGRKYTTKFNSPNLVGPPTGYSSIRGERGKDLNYDEIVVYDSHAICPQYIIFCQK